MTDYQSYYINEEDWLSLDLQGAAQRLGKAITFRTVNDGDSDQAFAGLRRHMEESYPLLRGRAQWETVGRSQLIFIPGSDPSLKPAMFISHMDVVGVDEKTMDAWQYPPFSGAVAEGYIWGRGALDIKDQIFACLEAAEHLLSLGLSPRRGLYMGFGDDEETFNLGAQGIAALLKSRGVELEFLVDEGGGSIEPGEAYCAPGESIARIHLGEKGYADLRLESHSIGGHSSRPVGGTSLEHIARAIEALCRPEEGERPLPPPLAMCLQALRPYVTQEPLKTLLEDMEGNSAAILDWCAQVPELFPLTATTVAPTQISPGSPAPNVLPQDMWANVNYRLIPGDSVQALEERCRRALEGIAVDMHFVQANDPSRLSPASGIGYKAVIEALEHYYKGLRFIPAITPGGTDARRYEDICPCCLRIDPFLQAAEDVEGRVHGINERIPLRAYAQGIRLLLRLMSRSCQFE